MRRLEPATPGELLRGESWMPMGLTQYRLAKEIGVPVRRIGDIAAGKRAMLESLTTFSIWRQGAERD